MKPTAEQDHYEILELARSASKGDVERAYRLARSIYVPDSLAGYPVFEEGDVLWMRERIDAAYRTLVDADARRSYDAELARLEGGGRTQTGETPPEAEAPPTPLDALEDLDESEGEFDGARLRRLRLHRGIEIEEIAELTKINPTYLRYLEEERFEELPATVYVRGFVMAFAAAVGLDPERVARSYTGRCQERREGGRRRRFARG